MGKIFLLKVVGYPISGSIQVQGQIDPNNFFCDLVLAIGLRFHISLK